MSGAPVALKCGGRSLDLRTPRIMGVLNCTPDSFSDGGALYQGARIDAELAVARARAMYAAGADIIDIGGESTRPGAEPVSEDEECDRVLPVLIRVVEEVDAVVSVDTSSPTLMREAAALGAGLINDVRALRRPGALEAARDTGLPVCLMHMRGEPGAMQDDPVYDDVCAAVRDFLLARAAVCIRAGIGAERILLDPGFGFGKSLAHNLALLRGLPQLAACGYPVLAGLSRKSMIGAITGRPVGDRLPGSLALAVLAVQHGARILRVHDVAETADALAVVAAVGV